MARLAAAAALALLALLCAAVAGLVVASRGTTVAVGLAAVVALAGAWLVVSGRGLRAATGWALIVTGIAGGVIITLSAAGNARGFAAAAIVLAIAYGITARLAGSSARAAIRAAAVTAARSGAVETFTAGKPWLAVNPRSGDGRAGETGLVPAARKLGIDVVELAPEDDLGALAEAAAEAGADELLGIASGDGGIGIVAAVAARHGLPLVCVPVGTRCHFALDLGLDRDDPLAALEAFSRGIERSVDVATIGERTFVNNVSFGLYAEMVSEPDYREAKMTVARRLVSEIVDGTRPPCPLVFSDAQGRRYDHAAILLVGVNAYELLGLGELGERPVMDGGMLQVTVLQEVDGATVARIAAGIALPRRGEAVDPPAGILQWEVPEFRIASGDNSVLDVGIDGEHATVRSPATIAIAPDALRVLVPPVFSDRRRSPFSPVTVRHLVHLVRG